MWEGSGRANKSTGGENEWQYWNVQKKDKKAESSDGHRQQATDLKNERKK